MESKQRRKYRITFYDGTTLQNRDRLRDELDAFWLFNGEIIRHEKPGANPYEHKQQWYVEANEGFKEAFREENQIRVRTTIREID